MAADVLRRGRERARTGSWRGDEQVAFLAPLPDAPLPSADFVRSCLDTLAGRGFRRVVTAALSPLEQAGFLAAGFDVQERLHLLGLDLGPRLPDLPPGPRPRRVARRHRAGVLAVDNAAFPPFWQLDEAGLADALRATPATRFRRVAIGDRAVVGYAICGRAGGRGYVQRLAVDPAAQRGGAGRRLLLDGLHWMRRHGARRAVVNTQMGNEAALALYRGVGFEDEPAGLSVLTAALP